MNEYIKLLALFMGASWLVGCSMLSPVKASRIGQVPLQVDTTVCHTASTKTQYNLYLPMTSAVAPYDSTEMIYQDQTHELKAYTYHQWVAPPAEQLRQAIASAVRHTGLYRSVWAGPSANADYVTTLNVRLTQFKQDLTQQHFYATLVVSLNASNHQQLQTRAFSVNVSATPDYQGMVSAANQAAQQLTCDVANWLVKTA